MCVSLTQSVSICPHHINYLF